MVYVVAFIHVYISHLYVFKMLVVTLVAYDVFKMNEYM